MFEFNDKTYSIFRHTTTYQGHLTIRKEHVISNTATCVDVFGILAKPESYDGERAEAIDDLKTMGVAWYGKFSIIEHPA